MYFQSSGYMATPLLLTVIATIRIPINKITFSLSWDLKKMRIRTCQKVTKLESCSKLLKYIDRKNYRAIFQAIKYIFSICVEHKCVILNCDRKPHVYSIYLLIRYYQRDAMQQRSIDLETCISILIFIQIENILAILVRTTQ